MPVHVWPITIGRSPDNDLPVDNLAVSNYHAKVYFEAGRMVIEDLDSLNGTFVNDLRVERATLHDGDNIHIGKHKIKVDTSGDAPVPWDSGRKTAAPRIDETMVLDTKERRQMLQQAAAMGESMQFASARMKVPTLVVLSGQTDQKDHAARPQAAVGDRDHRQCQQHHDGFQDQGARHHGTEALPRVGCRFPGRFAVPRERVGVPPACGGMPPALRGLRGVGFGCVLVGHSGSLPNRVRAAPAVTTDPVITMPLPETA